MLDLQARIGLDEVVPRLLDEEFERPQVPVVRSPRERDRGGNHALMHGPQQFGRGRDLDELLVASLQGAVSVPELSYLAIVVRGDLDFHMPHAVKEALHEHILQPERGECFRTRSLVS